MRACMTVTTWAVVAGWAWMVKVVFGRYFWIPARSWVSEMSCCDFVCTAMWLVFLEGLVPPRDCVVSFPQSGKAFKTAFCLRLDALFFGLVHFSRKLANRLEKLPPPGEGGGLPLGGRGPPRVGRGHLGVGRGRPRMGRGHPLVGSGRSSGGMDFEPEGLVLPVE